MMLLLIMMMITHCAQVHDLQGQLAHTSVCVCVCMRAHVCCACACVRACAFLRSKLSYLFVFARESRRVTQLQSPQNWKMFVENERWTRYVIQFAHGIVDMVFFNNNPGSKEGQAWSEDFPQCIFIQDLTKRWTREDNYPPPTTGRTVSIFQTAQDIVQATACGDVTFEKYTFKK
jgi:hypothetical protein